MGQLIPHMFNEYESEYNELCIGICQKKKKTAEKWDQKMILITL